MSLEAHVPDVIRHTALRSSDFPPPVASHDETGSDRPAPLLHVFYRDYNFLMDSQHYSEFDLETAHKHCFANRLEIERSSICGCFYCFATFSPAEIQEWVDEDRAALCPKCPVDAVLGSASGYPIERAFLQKMHAKYF
jgi:hypothetical protein